MIEETGVDGLGRTEGGRMLDRVTGEVEADGLRKFAELCDVLAIDPPGLRWWWQRGIARFGFRVASQAALDVAEQLDETGLALENVRDAVARELDVARGR